MEDKLINLEDMRSLFRKRLWIIIVVTALTTVLGIYKTRQMAPTYTGSMKFLVSTSDKLLNNYSEDEIEAYSKFMATFNEIMKIPLLQIFFLLLSQSSFFSFFSSIFHSFLRLFIMIPFSLVHTFSSLAISFFHILQSKYSL